MQGWFDTPLMVLPGGVDRSGAGGSRSNRANAERWEPPIRAMTSPYAYGLRIGIGIGIGSDTAWNSSLVTRGSRRR